MQHEQLITGIAAALAGSAGVLAILGVIYNPAILFVAAAVGAAAYFMWFQASGRMAERLYRSVERQGRANDGRTRTRTRRTTETGGFGAGPREEWTPPGGRGRGARQQRQRADGRGGQRQQGQRRRAPSTDGGPSVAEAYRTLGLKPGADDEAVKQAYRQKVKEVHPDTDGGDEERFKRVNNAYERLS